MYIFTFCLLLSGALLAQNIGNHNENAANLDKYWAYRARFLGSDSVGGFVSVGLGQGESLPASGRNRGIHCGSDWLLVGSKCELHEGKGLMTWGDGTYYLGYYVAMLAFEIANIEADKGDSRASRAELFCALKAFERLDYAAELALGMPQGAANGFFLRDDVPADFYYMPNRQPDRRFRINATWGYECVASDYSCYKRDNPRAGGYTSQDQIIALLLGFGTVCQLLPQAEHEHLGERYILAELAQLYADRMVHYLIACGWQLRTPTGIKIPSRWGGDVRAFNFAIAKAAERICGKRFRPTYQAGASRTLGKTMSNSFNWAWNLQNLRNYSMAYALAILNNDWSAMRFTKRSHNSDQAIYSLWDAALNNKKLLAPNTEAYWRAFLATAPDDAPCHNSPDCVAPEGWRSFDRWWHVEQKNGNDFGFHFEFSGLDYMLAYNIYHFHFRQQLPTFAATKNKGKY
jgi:hypothetical protein